MDEHIHRHEVSEWGFVSFISKPSVDQDSYVVVPGNINNNNEGIKLN